MFRKFFWIKYIIVIFVILIPFTASAYADNKDEKIKGKLYQFTDAKEQYTFSAVKPVSDTNSKNAVGELFVNGDFIKCSDNKTNIPTFIVKDETLITINYRYTDNLLNAGKYDWHLHSDSSKTIDNIKLEEKIKNGAIILQTSRDAKKWVTISEKTDFIHSAGVEEYSENTRSINNIQLLNGCYYRIIVAYETAKTDKGYFNPLKLAENKPTVTYYNRYLELYEFYASYKNENKPNRSKKEHKYYSSTEENGYTVRTKKNDYSGQEKVELKDPHYGMELGYFTISGYSRESQKENRDLFLKSVGDDIKLTFHLNQDISQIKGDSNISVSVDKNGYDSDFQQTPHNMGHGELIVKHIKPNQEEKKVVYSDFLEALAFPGADTDICLYEEGQYDIHLDYAITNKNGIDKTTYYKMSFAFEIGNSNTMVYVFDISDKEKKKQLASGDITSNGFYIDDAKSESVNYTIKKEVLNDGLNGLTEDVRFNQATTAGRNYTDEGIYTITAKNKHTEETTSIKIYVGNNNILKAYTKYPENYTLEQLNNMYADGLIDENGDIIEKDENIEITTEFSDTTTEDVTKADDIQSQEQNETYIVEETTEQKNVPIVFVSVAAVMAMLVFIGIKSIKK